MSFAVQLDGLIGERGIAPAKDFLDRAKAHFGGEAWWQVPTLAWWNASDGFLLGLAVAGMIASLVIMRGFSPGACAVVAWSLYLSLCSVGSPFFDFQWDVLLLETAMLGALFLPWRLRPNWNREPPLSRIGRWLVWWLVFRLMFESGVVKLTWGDETWLKLRALEYHFETQPLPLWTAWYAHHLPSAVLWLSTAVMFVIEIVVPFLIVLPRWWRRGAALALIFLQIAVLLTGNYAFFNLLNILICLPLLDDAFWPEKWRARLVAPPSEECPPRFPCWQWIAAGAIGLFVVAASAPSIIASFNVPVPAALNVVSSRVASLRSFNGYGLFRVMTTERQEIAVEGSNDGINWRTYEFRWKPGDIRGRPRLVAPHQPRLDWQMWFAALGDVRHNPWFVNFLVRLLEGSPEVLDLLASNPFPDKPPHYVRAVLWDYEFTDFSEPGAAWWKCERKGLYCPPISLQKNDSF